MSESIQCNIPKNLPTVEKVAVARIFSELIKADHTIDIGEIKCWNSVCRKYFIGKAEETQAQLMPFAKAIHYIIHSSVPGIQKSILEDCANMTVSDGFCAHSEALIMIGLAFLLDADFEYRTELYSIPRADFNVDTATAIYIESEYDPETNSAIQKDYRAIFKELQLVGFHLIYLPVLIEHYRNAKPDLIRQVLSYLAPSMSDEGIEHAYHSLIRMTTENFCKDLLCNKCGISELRNTYPALFIKINNSYVGEFPYANYLKIEVDSDILKNVQAFVDRFSSIFNSDVHVVKTFAEREGRFNYQGFYKQLLDLFLIRKNIRSKIIIDPYRQEIFFPDIDARLEGGVHRKERVLYILLLCCGNDGVNFKQPASATEQRRYENRMGRIIAQYRKIYDSFGANSNPVPDIAVAEIRNPMLSNLRRAINRLDALYNPGDYIPSRRDGVYSVNVEPEIVYVVEHDSDRPVPLTRSRLYLEVKSIR